MMIKNSTISITHCDMGILKKFLTGTKLRRFKVVSKILTQNNNGTF